mgnify:CR=1 FL=1
MTPEQIKTAINAGKDVRWANDGYVVTRERNGQYLITFTPNNHAIGLTDVSGTRLNGDPDKFYIKEPTPMPEATSRIDLMLVPMMQGDNPNEYTAAEPKLGDPVEFYDVVLRVFDGDDVIYDNDWSFETYDEATAHLATLANLFPDADCEDLTDDIRLAHVLDAS